MKISVSLPDDDVRFLDAYALERGLDSRSAALHRAVRMLRTADLGASYEAAWEAWSGEDDASLWEATARDGLRS